MSIWLIALLRWVIMAINSVEIIFNLVYLIISFGSEGDEPSHSGGQRRNESNNRSPWLTILTQSSAQSSGSSAASTPTSTISSSSSGVSSSGTNNENDGHVDYDHTDGAATTNGTTDSRNGQKTIQFGKVTTMDKNGKNTVADSNAKQFGVPGAKGSNIKETKLIKRTGIYKTLPKAFGRANSDVKNAKTLAKGSSMIGKPQLVRGSSQESLKSADSGINYQRGASNGTLLPPPPPPPVPPRASKDSPSAHVPMAVASNSPQTRNQLAISLCVSLTGFFTAQFRLTWLLLFYSLYLSTGVAIWFYSRTYVYRKTRANNPIDQFKMIRSLEATPLTRSAPCQSSCVSSALAAMVTANQTIDEMHVQLMAQRTDVLDVGLKLLLSSTAFLLSSC